MREAQSFTMQEACRPKASALHHAFYVRFRVTSHLPAQRMRAGGSIQMGVLASSAVKQITLPRIVSSDHRVRFKRHALTQGCTHAKHKKGKFLHGKCAFPSYQLLTNTLD